MKAMATNAATVEALVAERLNGLRAKSVADLVRLADCSEEAIGIDASEIKLSTFHQIVDGKHRVVVQGAAERWGGITAKVVAKGFEITTAQSSRDLRPDELYDFS
jgi:hypothetical protein